MQLQHTQSVPGENTTQKIGKEPVGTSSSKGRAFVTEARRFERKPQEDFFEDVEILEQKQSLAHIACIAAICLVYPVLVQSRSAARCCLQRHCHCPAYRPRRKQSREQSPELRPLSVRRSAAAKGCKRWEKMLYLQHFPSSSAAQGNMVSAAEVHVSANISNIHLCLSSS